MEKLVGYVMYTQVILRHLCDERVSGVCNTYNRCNAYVVVQFYSWFNFDFLLFLFYVNI